MTDEQQKKIFSKNLRYYVQLSGKQQKEIAEALGVNQKTFNGWCTGLSMPKTGKIQKMADYFKIGKSDLLDDKSSMDYRHYSDTLQTRPILRVNKNPAPAPTGSRTRYTLKWYIPTQGHNTIFRGSLQAVFRWLLFLYPNFI